MKREMQRGFVCVCGGVRAHARDRPTGTANHFDENDPTLREQKLKNGKSALPAAEVRVATRGLTSRCPPRAASWRGCQLLASASSTVPRPLSRSRESSATSPLAAGGHKTGTQHAGSVHTNQTHGVGSGAGQAA